MPLLDIRQKFVETSGRYDLVVDTTSWADSGADWFIKAGQRYLDRMLETGNARARYFKTLSAGDHTLRIQTARVIEKVFRITSEGKFQIAETTSDALRQLLITQAETGSTGAPQYYTPTSIRIGVNSDLSSIRADYATVTYADINYSGIFFGNKADVDYGIEIEGLFYSPDLIADTSMSFWTEVHPEILVMASFMSLERFYRNFEGSKEARAQVDDLVQQLDFDYVAQEIVNIVRLGG